jgi:hypothetical protein
MPRPRLALALVSFVLGLPLAAAVLPRQSPFAARPKPEHALLKRLAGKWKTDFELTMPGIPPIQSHGTETNEMLGDLWLVSRYDDPGQMGVAFSGAQIFGYDADAKQYVSAWADSQSADLSVTKGKYDEATQTLTMLGTSKDPMTGAAAPVRNVMSWDGDDHRSQQMFVPGPGGKEMELFTIEYERVK